MLRFDDRVWLLWAAWILLLPLNWLAAAATAAAFHEICHGAAVILLGGKIRRITVAPFGAVIEAEGIEGFRAPVCSLAGPLGSFGLAMAIHRLPLLGLCALVQGGFNLLPVYPLDGGQALTQLLESILPKQARLVTTWVERTVLFLLLAATVTVCLRYSLGLFPISFCVFAIILTLLRKRP